MPHLIPETLARLTDEAPDPDEAAHLSGCAECRAELEGLRKQGAALRELPAPPLPPDGWESLEFSLRQEGLVRSTRRRYPALARIAAALVIFLMGALAGSWWTGAGDVDRPLAGAHEEQAPVVDGTDARALWEYAGSLDPADGDPLARLAILETILITTGAALAEAPADPVINGYHLSAREARDAVLLRLAERDDSAEWF